jgi:hypothetical protein
VRGIQSTPLIGSVSGAVDASLVHHVARRQPRHGQALLRRHAAMLATFRHVDLAYPTHYDQALGATALAQPLAIEILQAPAKSSEDDAG